MAMAMTMASKHPAFTDEELTVDQNLGYPKAYSKLCTANSNSRSYNSNPYSLGPPLSFLPYTLQPQDALRAKDLNQLFPIIEPDLKHTANPRGFVNLLWKQLDHLGNAGFDPALFRLDPFGNVLYLHADSASPLAWEIDHWFPCSRGGRTVPSNLRILQWQVCRKKKDRLEFLVPWWDLQLGISVNQFLSIFASKNSDFRNRAFSFLFSDGGSEELNALQAVDSHKFPQHFVEMTQQVGLAPAAIVSTKTSSDSSVLKPLDTNKSLRHNSPFPAIKKSSSALDEALNTSKENEQPGSDDFTTNPYLSITRARDSLRQRDEFKRKETEMSQLEEVLNELRQKNETERIALQDLEALLIKRRRRVEKCKRLSEAQSSYKALLEKMIRDAMHQSVVYKEQLRLNQAATSALLARLEAQRTVCDSSENELRRKYKQRGEIERQITRPCWEEQTRKRSRIDHALFEERHEDCIKGWTPLKKELRVFLEAEHKASEAGLSPNEEEEDKPIENLVLADNAELGKLKFREGSCSKPKKMISRSDERLLNHELGQLAISEIVETKKPALARSHHNKEDEDEEQRKQVGKGNVEKWLEIMLQNAKEEEGSSPEKDQTTGDAETTTVERLNLANPEKEIKYLRLKPLEQRRRSFSESREGSSRGFRSVPSSPSMMRSVDCIGKKPKVMGDENLDSMASISTSSKKFIESCSRTIRRAVNR